jgi:hypothetical protein
MRSWKAAGLAGVLLTMLAALALLKGPDIFPGLTPLVAGAPTPQALGNGQFRYFPQSARVKPGATYTIRIYTHCGLDFPTAVDFDGSFWDPAGPGLPSDGSGNPPAGFGNPTDTGTITLLKPGLASYQSQAGGTMNFTRHVGPVIGTGCW